MQFSENGDSIPSTIVVKLPHRLQKCSFLFVGSCKGLLCMQLYVDGSPVVYVTNPILVYGVELPRHYALPEGRNLVRFKFGFSSTANKFKVLKIAYEFMNVSTGECEILTVGVDDKWRHLPNSVTNLPRRSDFVALDGIFHWIPNNKGPDFIRTLDLGEEKFGQISIPPSLLLVSKPVHMAVFGKQLCLVDSSVQSQVSIWTLKKDPVGESWTKIVLLDTWLTAEVHTPYLIPEAAVQRGDMLFHCWADLLISYNVEQKRCSKINFKTIGDFRSAFLLGYTPSFSLPAGIIMEREQDLHADVIIKKGDGVLRMFSNSRRQ